MRFVARAFAQAKELLLSLSPAMRLVAGLLLVAVVIGLWLLIFAGRGSEQHYLLGGRAFNATEIIAAQKAFAQAGLNDARIDGNRIHVPPGQETAYVGAMAAENALPDDFGAILEKALGQVNPFMSPSQRDELVKSARERELASIIKAMPDMENAAVKYDRRRQPGISRPETVTASVTLWPQGGAAIEPRRLRAIRQLVAKSIAGLELKDVIVYDSKGGALLAEGTGGDDGEDSAYLQHARAFQKMYETNVLKALTYVLGVSVAATVELTKELDSTQETKDYTDKNKGTVSSSETSKQSTIDGSPGGGSPGLEAQSFTPNRSAKLGSTSTAARGKASSDKTSDSTQQFALGHDIRLVRFAGLTPKSVSVAVSVPKSYFEEVWRQEKEQSESSDSQNPVPPVEQITEREKTKIAETVASAIPQPEGQAGVKPRVTVNSFALLPPPQPPVPPVTDKTLGWLSRNWTTVALLGLVVFGLVMLRSIAKAVPVSQAAPQPVGTPESARPEPVVEATRCAIRREAATESLRDELTSMVRDDPETAASVIRGWIGSAG